MRLHVDTGPVVKYLTAIERQHLPFAEAKALTAVASLARGEVIREMNRQFDRPMPQTVNEKNGPLWLKSADYKKIRSGKGDFAEVRVKDRSRGKSGTGGNSDPAIAWLSHNIHGGPRIEKRSEYLLRRATKLPPNMYMVPARDLPTDEFGNVYRGEIQKIIADVSAHYLAGYDANATAKSKAKRRANREKRAGIFYFSTYPVTARTRHLAPGIYLRIERKIGGYVVGADIKPAFLFVKRPRYRQRIRFFDICNQVGTLRFPAALRFHIKQALENPRAGHGL